MKIKKCSCVHKFQDKRYGKGKRAHTINEKNTEFTCSVCGKVNK